MRNVKVDGSGTGVGTIDIGAYEMAVATDYDKDVLADAWEM